MDKNTMIQRQRQSEHMSRFQNLPDAEQKAVQALLRGGVDPSKLPCRQPKVVRIFVCSSGQGSINV